MMRSMTHRQQRVAAVVAASVVLFVGCGSGDDDDADTAASTAPGRGAFPVTIEHKYGATDDPRAARAGS